ncbi:hypothetical protein BC826DRAFT_654272 [Russula brevipes]|nr:hypothetical protein BC826DRAFT_654272 [Russula brevipes]
MDGKLVTSFLRLVNEIAKYSPGRSLALYFHLEIRKVLRFGSAGKMSQRHSSDASIPENPPGRTGARPSSNRRSRSFAREMAPAALLASVPNTESVRPRGRPDVRRRRQLQSGMSLDDVCMMRLKGLTSTFSPTLASVLCVRRRCKIQSV